MSSALRLSIIMVLLLATAALGLIAFNANVPKPVVEVAQVAPSAPAPVTSAYFVAAHPLPAGTLARDEDFEVRNAPSDAIPTGAILNSPDSKVELRGSLVRKYLDTGSPITAQDVLRPRDRGFLASVLAPDTRAISINVDAESGVSGLIWPGDYVDIVLTQVNDKADAAHRTMSETVLRNVRVIAIDQEIVEGASVNNSAAGKVTHAVSLQLTPEQVNKTLLAKELGKLSLAIRAAVEERRTADTGTMSGCEVSPEIARQIGIARQNATVEVYSGGKVKEVAVKKDEIGGANAMIKCDGSVENVHPTSTVASLNGDKGGE